VSLSDTHTLHLSQASVGVPLPGVSVRIVDEDGNAVNVDGKSGELRVKGPSVFREYVGDGVRGFEQLAHKVREQIFESTRGDSQVVR